MSVRDLLEELRGSDVHLTAEGLTLRVDAPAEIATTELLAALRENKRDLIRLLEKERLKLEKADRCGLVVKWAREPGYIALHDPNTGEWRELPASQCPPWALEDAKAHHRRGKAGV